MKNFLKLIANIVFLIGVTPFWGMHKLFSVSVGTDSSFWGFSQFFSLFPGKIGCYLRKNFYRLTMTYCDRDCSILFGTIFSQADTEIGTGVYIGPNCNIGKSKVEKYCTLGSSVHIMSGRNQHRFDRLDMPIKDQGGSLKK